MSVIAPPCVSVVITAFNAEATIADAVQSALCQPETCQVIVIDDASRDRTADAAARAAGGDARLHLIRRSANGGPSAARNQAIEAARGSVIALLDADDFFLPGRLGRLLAVPEWEMIADNILFIPETGGPQDIHPEQIRSQDGLVAVGLETFVHRNLSRSGSQRGEWGFLKPLMQVDFLRRHGLCYDESLRLGEDYDLYVRMLHAGARFKVSLRPGYAARWRDASLSSQHRTADLKALHDSARGHLDLPRLSRGERAVLGRHAADLNRRHLLREALDRRVRDGRLRTALSLLARPQTVLPVARGVLADKLAAGRPAPASRIGRLLIESP